MNRKLYPHNWEEISLKVRKEAGHKCEFCGVPDRVWIIRNKFNPAEYVIVEDSDSYFKTLHDSGCDYGDKIIEVILTVAHLDHNPGNNERANLRALCQRCHNVHDAPNRAKNARMTRIKKKQRRRAASGQLALIGGGE